MIRALVRRAGRKQHLATLAPGAAAWIPVCDVPDLPVFGADVAARDDWNGQLAAAQTDAGSMCVRCRNQLLVAARALDDVEGLRARLVDVAALELEVRTLRADLSRWTTAALTETKRHAMFVRDHVTFRRAARQLEATS